MSYCLNPHCQKPQNPKNIDICLNCGTQLLLKQRYRTIKAIGQGGFGRTLLAVDESKPLKPACVIKQFIFQSQSVDNSQKAAELFQQEALRLANLGQHNQIPNLLDYLTQEEYQYLVQEYIDGYNLADILTEQGVFNETQIWELLNNLLPVFEYIHSNDVIHRDIKPQNIIRSRNGKLYLVDFGAAKVVTGTAILQTGTSIGTPEFVAPEQSRGKATYSSDLYSLGTTCIYLLTGISPFDLFDISEYTWVWRQYLVDNPVSEKLGNILDKLIENATSRRYQSASEVLNEINPLRTLTFNHNQLENKQILIKKLKQPVKKPILTNDNRQYFNSNKNETNTEEIATKIIEQKDEELYPTWKCINTLHHHAAAINSIDITSDGKALVSGSSYCAIKLSNIETGRLLRTFCSEHPINTVAISPNGLVIASGDSTNNILLWNINSSKKIKIHTGFSTGVHSLSFSPDGQILASAGGDKTVKLWNVNTTKKIRTLIGHDRWVSSLDISLDGKFVVSGSADGKAIIWDLHTGKLLHAINIYAAVRSVVFSPDSRFIITGSEDSNIKLWEVTTGQEIYTLEGHSSGIKDLTFNPNGKILASSSTSNYIKLWDMNTKQKICTLQEHSSKVNSLVFSRDGKTLFSASNDSTIKVWQYK